MKNAIALLLLLLCIIGCKSQNQEGTITFAKGYEDNPAIPKIDTAHYYEGEISGDSVQQIIHLFNASFGRFTTPILRMMLN